jgi:hypothetical protein
VIAHCSERLRGGVFGVERKRALTEFDRLRQGLIVADSGQ